MSMESPAAFNQAGGSYTAEQTRRAVFAAFARTSANAPGILAGGTLSASDLILSAPGSGLSVNVSTGEAIVGGSEGGTQGGYYARNASTTNLAISTANATNPRIDTVCLTIADAGYTEPTGVSGNAAVLQVVTGTATSGANLTNLSGKAGLPLSSLLLGYVLVPAAASSIVTNDIANQATPIRPGQGLANPIASSLTQPSRSLATVYQPNALRPTLLIVIGTATSSTGTGVLLVNIGATGSPATVVAETALNATGSVGSTATSTCVVPAGWFYEILNSSSGGAAAIVSVTEIAL